MTNNININFKLNGKKVSLQASPKENVLELLRRNGIRSVKDGCSSQGSCGNCSIILDGKLVNSCMLRPWQIDERDVFTVEGLSTGRELHPIQEAFIKAGLVQCGYCTPAQILAVKVLLDENSDPTREEISEALSGIICRCHGYEQIFDAVKSIKTDVRPGPEFREDLNIVGKRTPKIDAHQLVSAEESFVEDMVPQDALHIKVLRSPHAHAKIKSIDTSKAEALDGVVLVVTHENAPKARYNTAGQGFPEPSPYDRRLVDDTVRFVGDRVAIVAAESLEIAEEALDLIKVDYEQLPAAFSIEEAEKEGAYPIHTEEDCFHQFDIGSNLTRNIAASNSGGIGDMKKGFEEADVIIEREYRTKRIQCTPLEPHAALARMHNGRLILDVPTQVPFHVRRIISTLFEIPQTMVRVRKTKVGGGFGAKQDMAMEEIPAWVSFKTGRAAYFRYTREEEFITRPRYVMNIKVKVGAKKDGKLTALEMNSKAAGGAYGPHCLTVPMNACSKSLPIFKCDNMNYSVTVFYTNNPISGAYQGYGAPQGSYAVQTAMAELADELGMDLLEFLKINAVRKGDMLEILKCLGEGQEGIVQPVSSAGIHEAIEKGASMMDWENPPAKKTGDTLIGRGAAIIQQGSGIPGIDAANAIVKQLGDGTFMVLFGGTDLGTGLDTVVAKVAAEALCVDLSSIAVTAADTDVTPFDVGSYASSGTYFSGMAVYRAAENMKKLLLKSASEHLGIPQEELSLVSPGAVEGGGKKLSYQDIAQFTQSGTGKGQLIAPGSFTSEKAPIPYGAHFVEVEINSKTGELKIKKYYALHDSGTPINPALAKGQIYGGVLKSIGHSLYEELKFNEKGECINPNFIDYKIPMIKELPKDFKAELIYVEDPLGPYGAK
ncbi:MAG: molybdopterin-dependent oxidoreductase, partial [Elusimicrobia bacterium]|nr:molybdopterin-dependent oxidoreductase [Elusimicrobiota bacterium]